MLCHRTTPSVCTRTCSLQPASARRPSPDGYDAVAKHKSMFFAEKAADRSPIDYAAAVNGNLVLTPSGDGLRALSEDYAKMVDDGLLLGDSEPFEQLIERCALIQERANKYGTTK
ncbi:hypothetical protein NXT3_PB00039 (plasmid) [Sinorhizobium fredii]|uniref:Uncharacterized protein n=1 Tax=Rhizobium fredii TaxID=380 RepID=A0A2L0HB14_RHIFR|nr:hypothetical protein NXT3_PB00039 [Sinorhizobium fredii]